jgi:hypothetical protein
VVKKKIFCLKRDVELVASFDITQQGMSWFVDRMETKTAYRILVKTLWICRTLSFSHPYFIAFSTLDDIILLYEGSMLVIFEGNHCLNWSNILLSMKVRFLRHFYCVLRKLQMCLLFPKPPTWPATPNEWGLKGNDTFSPFQLEAYSCPYITITKMCMALGRR